MTEILVSEVEQRSTQDSITRSYYFYNDDHITDVAETDAITSAYQQFLVEVGISGTNHQYERISDHSARVRVVWEPGNLRQLRQPAFGANGRAMRWRFQHVATGRRVFRTKLRYYAIGPDGHFLDDGFGSDMIGISAMPNQMARITGIDVPPPQPTFNVQLHVRASEVTGAFIKAVGSLVGTVAKGTGGTALPFSPTEAQVASYFADLPTMTLGGVEFEEGELFWSSLSGGQADEDRWLFNCGIAYAANVKASTAPIPLQANTYNRSGHDIEWTYDRPDDFEFGAGGEKAMGLRAQAFFVDQVWDYADWSAVKFPTTLPIS